MVCQASELTCACICVDSGGQQTKGLRGLVGVCVHTLHQIHSMHHHIYTTGCFVRASSTHDWCVRSCAHARVRTTPPPSVWAVGAACSGRMAVGRPHACAKQRARTSSCVRAAQGKRMYGTRQAGSIGKAMRGCCKTRATGTRAARLLYCPPTDTRQHASERVQLQLPLVARAAARL